MAVKSLRAYLRYLTRQTLRIYHAVRLAKLLRLFTG